MVVGGLLDSTNNFAGERIGDGCNHQSDGPRLPSYQAARNGARAIAGLFCYLADSLSGFRIYQRAELQSAGDCGVRYAGKLSDVLDRGLMKDALRAIGACGSCNSACNIVCHSAPYPLYKVIGAMTLCPSTKFKILDRAHILLPNASAHSSGNYFLRDQAVAMRDRKGLAAAATLKEGL